MAPPTVTKRVPGVTARNQPIGAARSRISDSSTPASQVTIPLARSKAMNLSRPARQQGGLARVQADVAIAAAVAERDAGLAFAQRRKQGGAVGKAHHGLVADPRDPVPGGQVVSHDGAPKFSG